MADSPPEAASQLQPPATTQSSFWTREDVLAGSSRSVASGSGSGARGGTEAGSVSSDGSPLRPPRRRDRGAARLAMPSSSSYIDDAPAPSTPHGAHHSTHAARPGSHRTSHRHNRSSGAFLLADALRTGAPVHDTGSSHGSHGSRHTHTRSSSHREPADAQQHDGSQAQSGRGRGGSAPATSETMSPARVDPEDAPDSGHHRSRAPPAAGTASSSASASVPASASASTSASGSALDLDSTQIVNMALNLSESRRLAARRTTSQQLPPRLAPLPDSAVGGSLLRQLQQQRRISRNMSPRPERPAGSRTASGQLPPSQSPRTSTSGLRPAFEPLGDSGGHAAYRYNFSRDTLARAQKAKEYLELQAQQRRLLELIPPLDPGSSASRSRATSLGALPAPSAQQSASPSQPSLGTAAGSAELLPPGAVRRGRAYNPLQYIRNRKVRVRERKAIDGQEQGFGDVARTTDWVDEVARWAATGQDRVPGASALPAFPAADAVTASLQSSPPPASRTAAQGIGAKPTRPRIDWVVDPADVIADVYWLEQGDNKKLVEDHHWRRVFPQDASLYRTHTQRTDDGAAASRPGSEYDGLSASIPTLTADIDAPPIPSFQPLPLAYSSEHGLEPEHGSTRRRARQKLNELRTFHHRHNSSLHSQDIMRLRRGSFSDTSDSDSDRRRFRRRLRADSGTTSGPDAANKNKVVMLARESKECEERDAASGSSSKQAPAPAAAAEMSAASQYPPAPASSVDSPRRGGRGSLDIPTVGRRLSIDYDSSMPTSPELRPEATEGVGFVPPLGGDLSLPPSRAASPPRHRFSKVKSMFRDHSREHSRDYDREREREKDARANYSVQDHGMQEMDDAGELQHQQHLHQSSSPPQEWVESLSAPLTATTTAADDVRFVSSHEGKGSSHSPVRKAASRVHAGTMDSHKTHGSIASMASLKQHASHQRSEDGGGGSSAAAASSSGVRGFLKSGGPRIDSMLRSGVSKVGDLFWRREGSEPLPAGSAEANASSSSDEDDSDADVSARGRGRKSTLPSRSPSVHAGLHGEKTVSHSSAPKTGERHYLDVMPVFGRGDANQRGQSHLSPDPVPRPPSRQSTRFERLKPPRIDVREASPSGTGVGGGGAEDRQGAPRPSSLQPVGRLPQPSAHDSEMSESDTRSRRSSRVSGAPPSVVGSVAGGEGRGGTGNRPAATDTQATGTRPRQFGSTSTAATGRSGSDRPRWSTSQRGYSRSALSRRDLARLRASMYSSAVLAKELARRANEPRVLAKSSARVGEEEDRGDDADDEHDAHDAHDGDGEDGEDADHGCVVARSKGDRVLARDSSGNTLTWPDIAAYAPNPAELVRRPIKPVELYPLAAQVLGGAIQRSGQSWQASAETFAGTTVPRLREQIDGVRTRVAVELSGLARHAADEADEVSRDLVAVQRLQVKRVEDRIEKMLRRRRRRFRWVRRAGWLTVEWLLVGFMWYVWFVVMLARVVLGLGGGIYRGARWLLWL